MLVKNRMSLSRYGPCRSRPASYPRGITRPGNGSQFSGRIALASSGNWSSRDAAAIAAIIMPVIREGATYALDPSLSEADALSYWMASDKETFVAEQDGVVVGTYYMRPNQAGGGRHVCNCGYMTSAAATGRGVARAMCEHSLKHARSRGYRAMQFNFVVSTNERAVRLWRSLGFDTVGRLPGAFRHPDAGYVDAFVMYREL
jgi:ribosomal protein S18 acetylase RimI-like enzyme